jgi:shikimate kinase
MAERYPVYAEANLIVESIEGPHDGVVDLVIAAIEAYKDAHRDTAKEAAG